jgi:hypothetical protein
MDAWMAQRIAAKTVEMTDVMKESVVTVRLDENLEIEEAAPWGVEWVASMVESLVVEELALTVSRMVAKKVVLAVVEMVVLKERELVERKVGHLDVFLAEKTVECLAA